MTLLFVAAGLFLIILGVLVKKHPNLLAGYNTLSESQKKEIDIEKVSTIARNGMVLSGAAVIDGNIIMYFLKTPANTQVIIFTLIITIGIVIQLILINRIPKIKS